MPLTVNEPLSKVDVGDREVLNLDLDADNSYPAGGYPLTHLDLPFRVQNSIEHIEGRSLSGTYWVLWDPANETLVWYVAATGAEVADTTDLSGETARCVVRGR